MPEITIRETTEQILAVLREAFEGAEKWSYFIDHGSGTGLLQFLPRLSAEEASRSWGGTSIAAHLHHLIFSLEASTAWISGDHSPRDWPASWSVSTVDPAAWHRMQQELKTGYQALRQAIEAHAAEDAEAMGGAVGVVAHVAYHLGAIRQKLTISRQGS